MLPNAILPKPPETDTTDVTPFAADFVGVTAGDAPASVVFVPVRSSMLMSAENVTPLSVSTVALTKMSMLLCTLKPSSECASFEIAASAPKPENVTSAAATDAVATSAVVAKTRSYSYKEPQSMSAYNDSLTIVWLSSMCSSDNNIWLYSMGANRVYIPKSLQRQQAQAS